MSGTRRLSEEKKKRDLIVEGKKAVATGGKRCASLIDGKFIPERKGGGGVG